MPYLGAMRCTILAFLLALVVAPPVWSGELSGVPKVVDGGTLMIAGRPVRLHGITAPAEKETCELNGQSWLCGWEASNALAFIVGRHWVTCRQHAPAIGGPFVATCLAGNVLDLNAYMVRNGWAIADRQATPDYVSLEEMARREQRGLWRGKNHTPTQNVADKDTPNILGHIN